MQKLRALDSPVNAPEPSPSPSEGDRRSQSDRLAELETICRYDRAGDTGQVFTCEKGLAASLLRRGVTPIRENRREGRVESWIFEVPKAWISVRPPRRVSETARHALAKRRRLALERPHGAETARELVPVEG
jgi:hypothetical protein